MNTEEPDTHTLIAELRDIMAQTLVVDGQVVPASAATFMAREKEVTVPIEKLTVLGEDNKREEVVAWRLGEVHGAMYYVAIASGDYRHLDHPRFIAQLSSWRGPRWHTPSEMDGVVMQILRRKVMELFH